MSDPTKIADKDMADRLWDALVRLETYQNRECEFSHQERMIEDIRTLIRPVARQLRDS